MKMIRIGLIGYGNWARQAYLPVLREDKENEIVAAAALTQLTRSRIKNDLGSGIDIFPNFQTLVARTKCDAILISLPDMVHGEAIEAVIDSGIPFFYEPPLSDLIHRMGRLINNLLKTRQLAHADLELRYIPVVTRIKELLAKGVIGEVQSTLIKMNGNWDPESGRATSLPYSLIPWYVDVLNTILGNNPRRVFVQNGRLSNNRMQASAVTQLDYGKVWGTFDANISRFHSPETWVEVSGCDGNLHGDLFTGEIRLRNRDKPVWKIDQVIPAQRPFAGWPGLRECLGDFLNGVKGQVYTGVSAKDMIRLQILSCSAEESIDNEAWVTVPSINNFLDKS